ncbi:MAG TPA: hypothetical protein DDZ80_04695 [Cyanobacteria bacterium UBA8803]|nr:hypothetical protein [Cyanobacteria bacterium UBA8803]
MFAPAANDRDKESNKLQTLANAIALTFMPDFLPIKHHPGQPNKFYSHPSNLKQWVAPTVFHNV